MGFQSTELKGRKRKRHEESVQRNRQAVKGKEALIATYHSLGLEPPADLEQRAQRRRNYLRNQIGEDE
jgi:hypothetical protein